jgi:hypothetical protein
MPATGTYFTAINPILDNASDNSGSWQIDAEVFDLSQGANILHNYYPLSGPDPYLPHQLSVEYTQGWTGKVTFTITYSGVVTSQETYSVGSYGGSGRGNCS